MRTSDLIAALAADPRRRGMTLNRRYFLALAAGLFVSACAFAAMVGPRDDIARAFGSLRFDWKFVDTIALAAPAILLAWGLLRPDAKAGRLAIGLLVPIVLLGGSVAMELTMVPSSLWMARMVGTNAAHCLKMIPLLSMAPLAALIFVMRTGAPARPRLAGAVAGLAAAAVGATLYAANCTDDSPLFVVTWYSIATAIVVGAGTLLGDRLLRW